jgi:septal ring factor EnvC (AmiA/AmiB activator)
MLLIFLSIVFCAIAYAGDDNKCSKSYEEYQERIRVYNERIEIAKQQQKKVEVQLKQYTQQQLEAEKQMKESAMQQELAMKLLKEAEARSLREEKLLTRREAQADRFDAILQEWEKQLNANGN